MVAMIIFKFKLIKIKVIFHIYNINIEYSLKILGINKNLNN